MNHWIHRLAAYIVDSIIIAIPIGIIYTLLIGPAITPRHSTGFVEITGIAPWWGVYLLAPLFMGIAQLLYFAYMESTRSATFGKKFFKLNVQMTNGSNVPFGKAIIRNLTKFYGFGIFLLIDWIIGIVTPGADNRQKFTDRIAETTVVLNNQSISSGMPPPPPPPPPPA